METIKISPNTESKTDTVGSKDNSSPRSTTSNSNGSYNYQGQPQNQAQGNQSSQTQASQFSGQKSNIQVDSSRKSDQKSDSKQGKKVDLSGRNMIKHIEKKLTPGLRVSSFLEDLLSDITGLRNQSEPHINVKETEECHLIDLFAPGYKKENFKVSLQDNELTISNEYSEESSEEKENWTMREFRRSSFSRSFYLPDGLQTENIKATYEDGILHIQIPKAKKEAKKSRAVEIQ